MPSGFDAPQVDGTFGDTIDPVLAVPTPGGNAVEIPIITNSCPTATDNFALGLRPLPERSNGALGSPRIDAQGPG